MRIDSQTRNCILEAVKTADSKAEVYLFGSRVDDHASGGDIDLLILSKTLGFSDHWPIRRKILDTIGWQKLDLIIRNPENEPDAITMLATEEGVKL